MMKPIRIKPKSWKISKQKWLLWTVFLEQFFYNKTKSKVELWTLTKRRIRCWWKGTHKPVTWTNTLFEKGNRRKNNVISLLIKTRKSYLIEEQNVSYDTKDGVSNERVSSNSVVVIPNTISNNSNNINNTNITVNTDDVSDIRWR